MPEVVDTGSGVYEIDARGYSCPYPEVLTREAVGELDSGKVLRILLDNRPSTQTVPDSLEETDHLVHGVEKLDGKKEWVIEVEVR